LLFMTILSVSGAALVQCWSWNSLSEVSFLSLLPAYLVVDGLNL
jgi:hypothetical protein